MRGLGLVVPLALVACASTAVVAPAPAPVAASAPQVRPPSGDADGDGIPDAADRCPEDAETLNGHQDEDGCPDLAPQSPESANDVGRIVERIGFRQDSAELKPAALPMLDAIAVLLQQQAQQFPLVALEGHAADNERSAMKLSLARASAVRVALLGRGVDGGRLLARASGSTAPSCAQRNESCRTRERTVEFVTLAAAKEASQAAETESVEAPDVRPPESKPAAERAAPPAPLALVQFKKGSAVLAPSALADLDILAGFMKANSVSVEIIGYADDRERETASLAGARAGSVRKYMMACGVLGEHLTVRTERTGRSSCPSHGARCPARDGRAELRFLEQQAPAAPAGAAAATTTQP